MTTSRNHQEANGIGQAEEQVNRALNATYAVQGGSEADREIMNEANRDAHTSLDEIIE